MTKIGKLLTVILFSTLFSCQKPPTAAPDNNTDQFIDFNLDNVQYHLDGATDSLEVMHIGAPYNEYYVRGYIRGTPRDKVNFTFIAESERPGEYLLSRPDLYIYNTPNRNDYWDLDMRYDQPVPYVNITEFGGEHKYVAGNFEALVNYCCPLVSGVNKVIKIKFRVKRIN